jgi:predicted transcriptional regulator
LDKIRDNLVANIDLSPIEAEIFLYLIINGKTSQATIANKVNLSLEKTAKLLHDLIEKGMILEISEEYETFHPKFSITNAYRQYCQRMGIAFKKNVQIDNLASVVEKIYESARTK